MELSGTVYTAQELFELLSQIPEGIRARLPIQLLLDDGMTLLEPPFDVTAFEVTETEGCIERGFQLSTPEEDEIDTNAELPLHPK